MNASCIVRLFAQNLGEYFHQPHHPKLAPWPYGIQPYPYKRRRRHPWPSDFLSEAFWRLQNSKNSSTKTKGIMHGYLNQNTHPKRENISSGPKLDNAEYYEEIARHRFILSPDGDRPECYRTFEAIGLGTTDNPILEAHGDKNATGHRHDSIPIGHGVIGHGGYSDIVQYLYYVQGADNDLAAQCNEALFRHLHKRAKGVIVRSNPGTLCPAAQAKLDSLLTELSAMGVLVLSTPEFVCAVGAKDAHVKIKHLHIGILDASVYTTADQLMEGFRMSIAFQPRVIKQNRGSQGEGIGFASCKMNPSTVKTMVTSLLISTRSWSSWRPLTIMLKSIQWQNSLSSVSTDAPNCRESGLPLVLEDTSKVALIRRNAGRNNASCLVLSKEKSDASWSGPNSLAWCT
ncbi:hypothetical protein MHU86_1161 [Fragilaria crotonensis]|nr:hypothetical protein MHU86_1161 [Fragilaria crotonensis]